MKVDEYGRGTCSMCQEKHWPANLHECKCLEPGMRLCTGCFYSCAHTDEHRIIRRKREAVA